MLLGSFTGRGAARKGARTAGVVGALALAACGSDSMEENPAYRPPVVVEAPAGRVVHNSSAATRWIPRRGVPDRPVFLFSGVLAAGRRPDGAQAVLPPAGDRLLLFDARGRFLSDAGTTTLLRAIAVAPAAAGWMIAERDGRILAPASPPFEVGAFPAGATIAPTADGLVAARSPFAVTLVAEPESAPLLVELSATGAVTAFVDTIVTPSVPELATITNAGHVAGSDRGTFFTFLTRDELRAYDAAGRRRWTADRGFDWPTPPMIPPGGSAGDVSYRPVNLALTAHGELVYLLSNASDRADSIRIDAFDAQTGALVRTATLAAAPWLISTDARGALWYAPADTLAVIGSPAADQIVEFRLPTLEGDTLDTRSLRGRVILLNFWASWCGPCREEFPHMASLARELAGEPFTIVAVSDDLEAEAARRFAAEFAAPFTIAWARGSLEQEIGYRGLPFTMLLDREGRVVQRYFGFGGAEQFARVRRDVERALAR